ncbi:unnamed protein product [Owenia fusiformis]|uniref:C3H1-type domain-containing protein n=1 Tax=Owenia fusiformis TaxID=6347 RepID=A0A8S4QB35_OWEFU|nr:unnamed protein product [Owenia fusiformis]
MSDMQGSPGGLDPDQQTQNQPLPGGSGMTSQPREGQTQSPMQQGQSIIDHEYARRVAAAAAMASLDQGNPSTSQGGLYTPSSVANIPSIPSTGQINTTQNPSHIPLLLSQIQNQQSSSQMSTYNVSGSSLNPMSFQTSPLEMKVNDKSKQKIWDDKYVDFELLYKEINNITGQPGGMTVTQLAPYGQNSIEIFNLQNHSKQKALSFPQWLKSFATFSAVYQMKNQTAGPQLMKHLNTVTDLYEQKSGWRYYDNNVRYKRSTMNWPWDVLHFQHWQIAKMMSSSDLYQNTSNSSNQQVGDRDDFRFPKGFCFAYHKGRYCNRGCGFKHACPKCDEDHMAINCRNKNRGNWRASRQEEKEDRKRKRDRSGDNSSKNRRA